MFDSQIDTENQPTRPLDGDEFTQTIVQRYAEQAESVGVRACIGAAVDEIWPAPGYREHQRDAVVNVLHELYVDDNDVVTLSAPTGAGKSLILHAAMAVLDNEFDKSDAQGASGHASGGRPRGDAFFSTPLNALIDQVDDDEFIQDEVVTLKGKNNYNCVHRQDRGTPVDSAVCQRVSNFECEHKDTPHTNGGCPYYGRKYVAQRHSEVVTNLSYLMANAMIPAEHGLSKRELVVVDECQKIEDFALGFVGFTVSKRTVPVVYDMLPAPPKTDEVSDLAEWLSQHVLAEVSAKLDEFEAQPELSEREAEDRDDLQEFERKVQNFLHDVQNHHWVVSVEGRSPQSANTTSSHEVSTRERNDGDWSVEFEPITVGRFLDQFLWNQGNKTIVSSATIPSGGFLEEVGLDDYSVGEVEVESTFPPGRRPVFTDETVGKMTMGERDETIPKMATKIADLAEHYEGERGFVHCHSYKIASRIYQQLPMDVRKRTRVQDGDDREQSLDDWLAADDGEVGFGEDEGGQVFLSVAMDEGISLDDWRARWQVVAKIAYPYMGADRVDYRLNELDDWNWYASKAAVALQQAVGRGMRSKDDWCHSYILDTSGETLIERNPHLFADWFLDAVGVEAEVDA